MSKYMTSMLKAARERGGMSIEDVAREIKIRRQYLIALEEDNLTEIPGEVYAQGYLRMYATYLGVDFNACNLLRADNSSSFWSRAPERIGHYGRYKLIISLFLIGILCIFCWHSLTSKVVPDSELGLLDRLGQYDAGEEASEHVVVDHNLVDTALGRVPTQESK